MLAIARIPKQYLNNQNSLIDGDGVVFSLPFSLKFGKLTDLPPDTCNWASSFGPIILCI